MGGVFSKPAMDAPPQTIHINLAKSFFDPYKDEKDFYCAEKEKIMRTAFLVFYMDELRQSLKYYVTELCSGCSQDIGGKAVPVARPHTCVKYESMRQAYNDYGACAVSAINQNNAIRWKICRKWWDFIFDLPDCSSITHKDAVKFTEKWENDYFTTIQHGWEEEFDKVINQFYWFTPNHHIDAVLKTLSKW